MLDPQAFKPDPLDISTAPLICDIPGYKAISLALLYSAEFAALHPEIRLPAIHAEFLLSCDPG